MKLIYDLNKIRSNNNGNDPKLPHLPVNGYAHGYAQMLSDGIHDGICFAGYTTKDEAIEAVEKSPAIPEGWHVYLLVANGRDSRCPDHIRWALICECTK